MVYGRTDIGRSRTSNQDAFACGRLGDRAEYAVVCDGMGGVNGGGVASAIAVRVIASAIAAWVTEDINGGGPAEALPEKMTEHNLRGMLESAFAAANAEILAAALADDSLRGMGTTAVAAVLSSVPGAERAYIVHVGDSRVYRLSEGNLEQMTRDHSIVQNMVEKGELTPSEAEHHPRKHFITRALGVDSSVECDYASFPPGPGGMLLLCTDGLTNMVDAEEIKKILLTAPAGEAADRLVAAANLNGGSDNTTAVIMTL